MLPKHLKNTPNTHIPGLSESECGAARETFDRIGDRWSLYIIGQLMEKPVRFNELRRSVEGVSQRMLTLTLRSLERDGLLSRTVYPTNPPQVEYALTERGHSFLEPVHALIQWSTSHQNAIEASRQHFDRERQKPAANG